MNSNVTTEQIVKNHDQFLKRGFGKSLRVQHTSGLQSFLQRGFPTAGDEDWKYSNLNKVKEYLSFANPGGDAAVANIEKQVAEALKELKVQENYVILFNGVYCHGLSRPAGGVKLEAVPVREKSYLTDLNSAFLMESLVVNFESNQHHPMTILHFVGEGLSVSTRLSLAVSKAVKAQVNEIVLAGGVLNHVTDINLEVSSRVEHAVIQNSSAQGKVFHEVTCEHKEKSQSRFFNLSIGAEWSRFDLRCFLKGSDSRSEVVGLYLAKENQVTDHCTKIFHQSSDTHSMQLYKGIVSETAKAIFNGVIHIEKNCAKSTTSQLNRNLALGDRAEVITRPQLEIYNDDVKANHGTTIGRFSDEELFYLQSRAIPLALAKEILGQAFIDEVLALGVDGEIRKACERMIKLNIAGVKADA